MCKGIGGEVLGCGVERQQGCTFGRDDDGDRIEQYRWTAVDLVLGRDRGAVG